MPDSPSTRLLRGQCLCGGARYEVAEAFRYAAICHCSNCRRTTGSAYKPFAGIEREKLQLVAGGDALLIVGEADNHDAHCRRCGSLLYSVVRDGAFVHVAMGTLVDDPSIRPTHHIFVGSKAAWEVIADGLPQYAEHKPPG
jgi:hypothetical protein